jgi:hypothetical protein
MRFGNESVFTEIFLKLIKGKRRGKETQSKSTVEMLLAKQESGVSYFHKDLDCIV